MKRSVRLTLLACAAALALAVTALAAASYSPSMGVFQATYKPGAAGAVTVVVAQETNDDPTARIVIYVGPGYTVTLNQPVGATIGNVIAGIQASELSPNRLPLTGPVKVDNPASHTADACAPGVHEAVWTLNAALPGQPANVIPVYVDHTIGAEAGFSSAKLTVCFRDPTLPAGDPRRAPNGSKFLDATFTVHGVFRNPSKAATDVWRSVFTPYTPGTGSLNALGSREAQAFVPLPFTVTARRVPARRGFFRVAGVVSVSGKRSSGLQVALYTGTRGKNGVTYKLASKTKTRRGKYAFTRRMPTKTTFVLAELLPLEASCAPSPTGAPCTTAIQSNAISRVLKIAPTPKKKRRR
jgi:hypothetical protein